MPLRVAWHASICTSHASIVAYIASIVIYHASIGTVQVSLEKYHGMLLWGPVMPL